MRIDMTSPPKMPADSYLRRSMNTQVRNHVWVWFLVVIACAGSAADGLAQQVSRRGITQLGPRTNYPRIPYRSPLVGAMSNPAMNRGNYGMNFGGNFNSGGPLSFDPGAFYSGMMNTPGQIIYVDPMSGAMMNDAMAMEGAFGMPDTGMMEGTSNGTTRRNIRPRINVSAPDAMQTSAVLQRLRQSSLERIAQITEKPFSATWYTSQAHLTPVTTVQSNPWATSGWKEVQAWTALTADPQRYDFRTDDRGLVLVYLNDTLQGRAVDERAPMTALADSAPAASSDGPALSLGVFAAVPPSLKPATTLFQLALDKSGLLTGVAVDLTSGEATPLRGNIDLSTQQAAWRIGDDVIEVGLANLTEDVARSLAFRADGWTQPWILIRVQEDQLTSQPAKK